MRFIHKPVKLYTEENTETQFSQIKTTDGMRWYRQHHYGELQCLLPNPNALVDVSKGTPAVKLCSNKILHFLTGFWLMQVVLYNACKMVVNCLCSQYQSRNGWCWCRNNYAYLAALNELCCNDDDPTVLLPNHPPEINDSLLQAALRCNVWLGPRLRPTMVHLQRWRQQWLLPLQFNSRFFRVNLGQSVPPRALLLHLFQKRTSGC